MRFLVLPFVLVSSLASADPVSPTPTPAVASMSKHPDAAEMHNDDCAKARAHNRACVIDMGTGDDIEGNSPTAGGSAISLIGWTKASSLIHIRRDFITEIIKTAEDL